MPESDWIISTGVAERNRVRFDMDGWELENYRANPVVFLNHMHWDPVIGRSLHVGIEGQIMTARLETAPTDRAREVQALIDGGFMRAASVGGVSLSWEFVRDSDGDIVGIHSLRQELYEWSVVGIPADPRALRAGYSVSGGPSTPPVGDHARGVFHWAGLGRSSDSFEKQQIPVFVCGVPVLEAPGSQYSLVVPSPLGGEDLPLSDGKLHHSSPHVGDHDLVVPDLGALFESGLMEAFK